MARSAGASGAGTADTTRWHCVRHGTARHAAVAPLAPVAVSVRRASLVPLSLPLSFSGCIPSHTVDQYPRGFVNRFRFSLN